MQKRLQKFTDSKSTAVDITQQAPVVDRVEALFTLNRRITFDDIDELTTEEADRFYELVSIRINSYKDEQRDDLIEAVHDIVAPTTRNQIWEYNHHAIASKINNFILKYGRHPSKNELAEETGLSRMTINKHLAKFETHPLYEETMLQFRILKGKLLANLYDQALHGNVKAARLFFEATGQIEKCSIRNQTNYIQINGLSISPDTFEKLDTGKQAAILRIIQKPKPDKT